MADAEGVIAELKNLHALDRVRCRGTPAFHLQLLLGCAAINLKRLAAYTPTANQGIAAAEAATAVLAPTDTTRLQLPGQQPPTLDSRPLLWIVSLCLN